VRYPGAVREREGERERERERERESESYLVFVEPKINKGRAGRQNKPLALLGMF